MSGGRVCSVRYGTGDQHFDGRVFVDDPAEKDQGSRPNALVRGKAFAEVPDEFVGEFATWFGASADVSFVFLQQLQLFETMF